MKSHIFDKPYILNEIPLFSVGKNNEHYIYPREKGGILHSYPDIVTVDGEISPIGDGEKICEIIVENENDDVKYCFKLEFNNLNSVNDEFNNLNSVNDEFNNLNLVNDENNNLNIINNEFFDISLKSSIFLDFFDMPYKVPDNLFSIKIEKPDFYLNEKENECYVWFCVYFLTNNSEDKSFYHDDNDFLAKIISSIKRYINGSFDMDKYLFLISKIFGVESIENNPKKKIKLNNKDKKNNLFDYIYESINFIQDRYNKESILSSKVILKHVYHNYIGGNNFINLNKGLYFDATIKDNEIIFYFMEFNLTKKENNENHKFLSNLFDEGIILKNNLQIYLFRTIDNKKNIDKYINFLSFIFNFYIKNDIMEVYNVFYEENTKLFIDFFKLNESDNLRIKELLKKIVLIEDGFSIIIDDQNINDYEEDLFFKIKNDGGSIDIIIDNKFIKTNGFFFLALKKICDLLAKRDINSTKTNSLIKMRCKKCKNIMVNKIYT